MNLAAVYNDAATAAGSPGRFEQLTPLQREAFEVMAAAVEGGADDAGPVALAAVRHLMDTYDLEFVEGAAETYLPLAEALIRAHAAPASAWADGLPTVFPAEPAPGAYRLPADAYHADPLREHGWSANASTLRRIVPPGCPALVQWDREHPQQRDAWDLGTVTHTMTLGTGSEIVEVEHKDWRTNDAKASREIARERGAVALLTKDLDACRAMTDAVRRHPLAGGLLRVPGASEVTLIWREPLPGTDRVVWGRCMVDRHPDPAIVQVVGDLKTAAGDLDTESLQRKAWDLGYHQAAEWYGRGYRAVHGVDLGAFWLMFVRKEPPHLVHVVELDADLLSRAREANDRALQIWDECQQSGFWPGPGMDDEPTLIGAPRWVR